MRKVMIIGRARHGKDSTAKLLEKHSLGRYEYKDVSLEYAKKFVFKAMPGLYATPQQCYDDRHNMRLKWAKIISEYLATPDDFKGVFGDINMLIGIRTKAQFDILKKLYKPVVIKVVRPGMEDIVDIFELADVKADYTIVCDNFDDLEPLAIEAFKRCGIIDA